MGFFSSKNKVDEEEKFLDAIQQGYLSNVTLPEVETVSHGMVTKGVATGVFGLVGLAMTMGSSNQLRKIRTIVRIPEKGIVIEKGTVNGKDIRIPWENILGASINHGVAISLVDGSVIEIGSPVLTKGFLVSVGKPDNLINYINDHARGQVEEGWDVVDDSYVDTEVDYSYLNITDEMIEKSSFSDGRPNFCMYCGHKVSEEDKHCRNCGHQLID